MTNKVALMVAVVLGVMSILLVNSYIKNVQEQATYGQEPVEVLAARKDIQAGEELSDDMVERIQIARKFKDRVESAVQTGDLKGYLGKRLSESVPAGQMLQRLHFRQGDASFAELDLEPGQRAVTLAVDAVTGQSTMLRPGDYVDVYGYFEVQEEDRQAPRQLAALLTHKMLVLAIDNITDAGGRYVRNYRTVTLRVEPSQVAKLILAANRGTLHMISMSEEEPTNLNTVADVPGISTDKLADDILATVPR